MRRCAAWALAYAARLFLALAVVAVWCAIVVASLIPEDR